MIRKDNYKIHFVSLTSSKTSKIHLTNSNPKKLKAPHDIYLNPKSETLCKLSLFTDDIFLNKFDTEKLCKNCLRKFIKNNYNYNFESKKIEATVLNYTRKVFKTKQQVSKKKNDFIDVLGKFGKGSLHYGVTRCSIIENTIFSSGIKKGSRYSLLITHRGNMGSSISNVKTDLIKIFRMKNIWDILTSKAYREQGSADYNYELEIYISEPELLKILKERIKIQNTITDKIKKIFDKYTKLIETEVISLEKQLECDIYDMHKDHISIKIGRRIDKIFRGKKERGRKGGGLENEYNR